MAKKPLLKRVAFALSPARAYRRAQQKLRRVLKELREVLLELFYFLTHGVAVFFYDKTLPFTSRLFSRVPKAPIVSVNDIRANRIRLEIKSSYASVFNVEKFEVEWAYLDSDQWTSIGANDLPHRTVARIEADKEYKFRVRAENRLGKSGWSQEVQARTKIDPKNGGGYTQEYTWEQTPTEVSIMFEVPPSTKKSDVSITLKPDWISVAINTPGSGSKSLLEGDLYARVRAFGGESGSLWQLVKEGRKLMLNITLEKHSKSLAPKFDYWRAIIPGQHEIDTHKITNEEAGTGMQMLQPGQYDPVQMRNMGIKGF